MTGVERIAAERERQRQQWGDAHDDQHDQCELAQAASAYLGNDDSWPWADDFKPSLHPVRDLEKAGALIAAELDRLSRAKERWEGEDTNP